MRKTRMIGLVLAALCLAPIAGAREYERRNYTCKFELIKEDMHTNETKLGSFTTKHYITWANEADLLLPKLEILPGAGTDPTQFAELEKRIRTDLQNSRFFWDHNGHGGSNLYFSGGFELNYDSIFLMIRAMGGADLDYTDDLTLESIRPKETFLPNEMGRYRFSMGRRVPADFYSSLPLWWRLQAHLPIAVKVGLSYHIAVECAAADQGAY